MGLAHALLRPGVQVHPFRVDELHLRDAHQAEHGLEVGVTASVVCPDARRRGY